MMVQHLHEVMTQYSVKQGDCKFGDQGQAAVKIELKQLHNRKVIKSVKACSLSMLNKQRALAYLMFLKQKRSGEVREQGCTKKQEEAMIVQDKGRDEFPNCDNGISNAVNVAVSDIPGHSCRQT